jgi:penicillin-binding protein 1A
MNRIFRYVSAGAVAALKHWRRTALSSRLSAHWAVLRDPRNGWGKRSRHAAVALSIGLVALFAITAASLLVFAMMLAPLTPSTHDLRSVKPEYPAVLRSADGKELATFRRMNREWVKLSRISPAIVDALIAAEDHRFFEHKGIDFKRTAAAVFHTATGDRQGGSTITQQLARNLYPDDIGRSLTLTRKIKEAITAVKIESIYSKQEILETYLNTVPFLYNAYGIEMAARTYFDKSAHELDALESATLIGMLKGTSYYNPVLNPERALKRRNLVLAQMVKHQRLTPARFEALNKQPLRLEFERQREPVGMAPHFAENLRKWLIEWADRNGHNLYADGLVIHTTIDSRLQGLANLAVARQAQALQAVADVEWGMRSPQVLSTDLAAYKQYRQRVEPFEHFWRSRGDLLDAFIRESNAHRAAVEEGLSDADALQRLKADAPFMKALRSDKTRLQAGFVAMDPRNGHVKAWVGSRDFQQDPFDHVQQSRRQPGSTFKPFVYAAAFEQGAKPGDTLVDRAVEIPMGNGEIWRPNEGDATTGTAMTLRDALAQSKNTITAQLVQRVGAGRAAELAHAMGVRQSKLNPVPSLALGTSPVTLKEMVSGYGTIANDGHYIEPILVTRIEDRHGRVLAAFEPPPPQPTISRASAHALIDAMRGVIDAGTGTAIREHFRIQADVAGKTGTTQNNTDGWFILMHPQLVGGAWVGFNDNRVAMRSAHWGQGGHSALHVVGDFYQQALATRAVDPRAVFAAPREPAPVVQEEPVARGLGGWLESVFGSQRQPDRKRSKSIPAGEIIPDE